MKRHNLATVAALGGAFLYASMSIIVKFATATQSHYTATLFRFLISFLVLMPWFLQSKPAEFKTHRPIGHICRGITGALALFCLFFAIKHLPVVNALLLNATFPIFIGLIYYFYKRPKTSPIYWILMFISFIGVILSLHPKVDHLLNPVSLIALLAGFLSGVSLVFQKELTRTESSKIITFYFFLISIIFTLPFAIWTWHSIDLRSLLFLIGIGVFGGGYQITSIYAYRNTSARYVSALMYSNVIFGGILGWLIFGQAPTLTTAIGAILVIASSIALSFHQKKLSPQIVERKQNLKGLE